MASRKNFIKHSAFSIARVLLLEPFSVLLKNSDFSFLRSRTHSRHILLRSGWQVENIGDIAHTPAMMALIENTSRMQKLPSVHPIITLQTMKLPCSKNVFRKCNSFREHWMRRAEHLPKNFRRQSTQRIFFLHNSGPATIAWANAVSFKKATGKPFGVFGVTYGLYGTPEHAALSDAAFVYCRDSVSLQKAKAGGVHSPVMKFSPDALLANDVTDDEKAKEFLKMKGLEDGKFLGCIVNLCDLIFKL